MRCIFQPDFLVQTAQKLRIYLIKISYEKQNFVQKMSLLSLAIIVNPVQGFMNSVLQVRRWGKESADNKWFLCYVRPHRRAVKCVQLFYIVETGVNGKKQD